ncbi:Scr1 family TA system antitoxin-like transcriptional regulator [Micromonospora sp. NBC_01412]
MARQAVLTGGRQPQFVAVLEEQVLRRQVGDRAATRE